MENAIGHVQTKLTPDEALEKLYELLAAKNAPKPGSFSSLGEDERRAYYRDSRRRTRARVKASAANGSLEPTNANIRDALADAATMILATGAPGAEHIRKVLATIFESRPGAPLSIEMNAKGGKLRTKLIARSEG